MQVETNFEEIIKKYQQKIYRIVFSLVGNEADTDEIVQKTFVNAFKNINYFKEKSLIDTWLIKIAVNNVRIHFRKRKFLSLFYVFGNGDEISEIRDAAQNTEKTIEDNIIAKVVSKAIKKLPERQKEVFVMKHINRMSISEISQVLSIAEGSVKSNIFKAINNLKKYLEDFNEIDKVQ
ncbi:MAG: sigma-70 family RNA polymerase sigma factor [Elusimicrobia bacterium]|nr:sigma-70 family RNA polymerase sigma factor [Elusimicrobiota bacterium]